MYQTTDRQRSVLEFPVQAIPAPAPVVPQTSLEDEVAQAEISAIQRSLQACNGDRLLAAQQRKIHVASLYRKMAKCKIK